MSHRSQRRMRKLKRICLAPYHALVNLSYSVLDVLETIISFIGLRRRSRRRNKDFDRAGRESFFQPTVDSAAAAELNKADRIRDQEIISQVKYENRVLRRNNDEARELKQAMEEDSLSFSQGAAINHLAEVNRRAAKKQKQRDGENGDSSPP